MSHSINLPIHPEDDDVSQVPIGDFVFSIMLFYMEQLLDNIKDILNDIGTITFAEDMGELFLDEGEENK